MNDVPSESPPLSKPQPQAPMAQPGTVAPKKNVRFVIPLFVGLGLAIAGWFVVQSQGAKAEAAAGEKIKSLGGLTVKDASRKYVASLNTATVKGQDKFDAIMESVGDLRRLQILDLSKSPVTSDQLAKLSTLRNLTTLQLDNTATGDDDIQHFRGMSKLESIYLGNTKVTDQGLANVADIKNLSILKISDTQVSDFSSLSSLPNLTWLVCQQPQAFTDDQVDQLSKIKTLRRLTINPAQLSDTQSETLKTALPQLSIE